MNESTVAGKQDLTNQQEIAALLAKAQKPGEDKSGTDRKFHEDHWPRPARNQSVDGGGFNRTCDLASRR
jgi:hypothetical protein